LTKRYVLTEAAEADLRGVIRYTMQRWGEPQVRRYIAELEQGIARLAEGDGPFKELGALYPASIVAIFHERMDLMARLADRL
jgi:plasmid stabilization system protein ParE